MSWKRESEWEEAEHIIKAYWSPEHYGVYYVTVPDEEGLFEGEDDGEEQYYLQYWPDKRKSIETVTLVDSFDSEEAALDALEEEIEESSTDD